MRRSKLDHVDLQILSNLQRDGWMINVNLARNVGISAPPCLRRLRETLEQSGLIQGYHAKMDGTALGYEVSETMGTWPEVRECHMARGPHDFVLRNTQHENELTQQLISAPHVVMVQTIQAIRTAKEETGVPIGPE